MYSGIQITLFWAETVSGWVATQPTCTVCRLSSASPAVRGDNQKAADNAAASGFRDAETGLYFGAVNRPVEQKTQSGRSRCRRRW